MNTEKLNCESEHELKGHFKNILAEHLNFSVPLKQEGVGNACKAERIISVASLSAFYSAEISSTSRISSKFHLAKYDQVL